MMRFSTPVVSDVTGKKKNSKKEKPPTRFHLRRDVNVVITVFIWSLNRY